MDDPSYSVFGGLTVTVDGTATPVTARRERSVLAALLVARGAPVPADRLVMDVWGEDAPRQALTSLQVAISRLRGLLEPDRAPRSPARRLVSGPGGYAIHAAPECVDAWVFEHEVARATRAPRPDGRLEMVDRALARWSAEPYAACESVSVHDEVERLVELRLTALEVRTDALLDLGRAEEAVRTLHPLAAQHPYRERWWCRLALAQYRSARQAEALATLRTLRQRLAEDLGVDPSPEAQRLEQDLLGQEPGLDAMTPVRAAPVRTAGAVTDGDPEPRPGRPTVGREAALRVLDRLVADLTSPGGVRSRVLLVAGEPGIGKSHLTAELVARARRAGARVLEGRCHEGGFAPAYWPWLPVLRGAAAALPGDPDPVLASVLEDTMGSADPDHGTTMRLYDAAADLVEAAAREVPTVLVLEDLHWADVSSLRLLRHVAERVVSPAVLIVATRRTTDVTVGDGADRDLLLDVLAGLARVGAERIQLEGLGPDEVARLLARELGRDPRELDHRVAEATAGNPFFVLELARLLKGLAEPLDDAPLPVPEGVRDVLRGRLGRLTPQVREVLEAGAVVGRSVDVDLVARVAELPVGSVLELLDEALASGLVVLTPEAGPGSWGFVHALTRETVYSEIPAARRMRLHDRAGRALTARGVSADAAAAVAHHLFLASPLGTETTALARAALARAAVAAEGRQAYAEALQLWRQAVEVVRHRAADVEVVAARHGEARALLRLSRTAEARAVVDEAARLACDLDRWDLVADAAGLLNTAGVWSWREFGDQDEAFIALLEQAAQHVPDESRARVLATLQMEHYYGREPGLAARLGEEAAELARRCGDEALLVEVLLVRVIASWGPGLAPARLAAVEELSGHAMSAELAVLVDFQHGATLYEVGRAAEADAVMGRCADKAAVLRHSGVEIPLAWWRFARACDRGSPDAAELGRAALDLHHASGYVAGDELEVVFALRSADPGSPVPARLRELAAASNVAGVRALVAHGLVEDGEIAAAREVLGPAPPDAAGDYSVLATRCLRVAVLAATGPEVQLRAELAGLEPYSGAVACYGTIDHVGVVDHFLALGLSALGEQTRARTLVQRAVAQLVDLDNRPWTRRAEELLVALGG